MATSVRGAESAPPPPPFTGAHTLRPVDFFYVVSGVLEESPVSHARRCTIQLPPRSVPRSGALGAFTQPLQSGAESARKEYRWSVAVLDRYPDAARAWRSVPNDMKLELLVFPNGFQLETAESLSNKARTAAGLLVTTGANGAYTYIVTLTFYVLLSDDECTKSALPSGQFWRPVVWALSSSWPYFTQMYRFLATMHADMYGSGSNASSVYRLAAETLIENLIADVKLPPVAIGLGLAQAGHWPAAVVARPFLHLHPASAPQERVQPRLACPWSSSERDARWDGSSLNFTVAPPLSLPLRDFSLLPLFQWLSVTDVLTCFSALLLEKRLLFVSSEVWKLTLAIEALAYLVLPFYPCSKTIHFLPPELQLEVRDLMEGPGPSMVAGILTRQWKDMVGPMPVQPRTSTGAATAAATAAAAASMHAAVMQAVPAETMVVLLDGPLVPGGSALVKHDDFTLPELPLRGELSSKLTALLKRQAEQTKAGAAATDTGALLEDELARVFLSCFFGKLLGSYRQYLIPLSSNPSIRRNRIVGFDDIAFVRAHPLKTHPFLHDLVYSTQGFQQFISCRSDIARVQPNLQSTFPAVQLEVLTFDHLMQLNNQKAATDTSTIAAGLTTQVLAPEPRAQIANTPSLHSYNVRQFESRLDKAILSSETLIAALAHEREWMDQWAAERASQCGDGALSGGAPVRGAKSHVSFFVRQSDYALALTMLRFKSLQLRDVFTRCAEYFLCRHESEARQLEESRLLYSLHEQRMGHSGVAESYIVQAWNNLMRYDDNELTLVEHALRENENVRATLLAMVAQSADIEHCFKELTSVDSETVRVRAQSESALRKYMECCTEYQVAVAANFADSTTKLQGKLAGSSLDLSALGGSSISESVIIADAAALVAHRFACHESFHMYAMKLADSEITLDFFDRVMPASIEQLRHTLVDRSMAIKQAMGRRVEQELEVMAVRALLLKRLQASIEGVHRADERALLQQQGAMEFWNSSSRATENKADASAFDEPLALPPPRSTLASPSRGAGHSRSASRGSELPPASSPSSRGSSHLTTTIEIDDESWWESESQTRVRSHTSVCAPMPHRSKAATLLGESVATVITATARSSRLTSRASEVTDSLAGLEVSYALTMWAPSGDAAHFGFVHARLHDARVNVGELQAHLRAMADVMRLTSESSQTFLDNEFTGAPKSSVAQKAAASLGGKQGLDVASLLMPCSVAFFHSLQLCHTGLLESFSCLARDLTRLSVCARVMTDSTERIESHLGASRATVDAAYLAAHQRASTAATKQEDLLRTARLKAMLQVINAVGGALQEQKAAGAARVKDMASVFKNAEGAHAQSRLINLALQMTRSSTTSNVAATAALAGVDLGEGGAPRDASPTGSTSAASPSPTKEATTDPTLLLVVGDHESNFRSPTKETQLYHLRLCNLLQLYQNNEQDCLQFICDTMRAMFSALSSFRARRIEQRTQLFTIVSAISFEQEAMAVMEHLQSSAPQLSRSTTKHSTLEGPTLTALSFQVDPDSDHPRPSNVATPLVQCVDEQMALLDLASRMVANMAAASAQECATLKELCMSCARMSAKFNAAAQGTGCVSTWHCWKLVLDAWAMEARRCSDELTQLNEGVLKRQLSYSRVFFAKWQASVQDVEKTLSAVVHKYVTALQKEQKAQVTYDDLSAGVSASKRESLQKVLETCRVESIREKSILQDACQTRNRDLELLLAQADVELKRLWSARLNVVQVLHREREDPKVQQQLLAWSTALGNTNVAADIQATIRAHLLHTSGGAAVPADCTPPHVRNKHMAFNTYRAADAFMAASAANAIVCTA